MSLAGGGGKVLYKEDAELVKFFDWVKWHENHDPRLKTIFHVANERRTSPQAGLRLKQKGVRTGIPDICVPIPRKGFHALYIELKIKPNKLTESQETMLKLLYDLGHCARVAWSGDEAIDILKSYLELGPST